MKEKNVRLVVSKKFRKQIYEMEDLLSLWSHVLQLIIFYSKKKSDVDIFQ